MFWLPASVALFACFLLSVVTVRFAFIWRFSPASMAPSFPLFSFAYFSQTSPNPPIPPSASRLQMMNLLNKQVKQSMTRTTCIICKYIRVRVACVRVRVGSICNSKISEEGTGWRSKHQMVFIRSLLYLSLQKCSCENRIDQPVQVLPSLKP